MAHSSICSPRWPLRRILFALFFAGLIALPTLADTADKPSVTVTPEPLCELVPPELTPQDSARLLKLLSRDDAPTLIAFLSQCNIYRLLEFLEACRLDPEGRLTRAAELAANYHRLLALQDSDPDLFTRTASQERAESLCRVLGMRVRVLKSQLESFLEPDPAQVAKLAAHRDALWEAVVHSAVQRHQNQLIELRRLEAEVRQMRTLLLQRDLNMEELIQTTYEKLSGDALLAE